jgi:hypothetical protein
MITLLARVKQDLLPFPSSFVLFGSRRVAEGRDVETVAMSRYSPPHMGREV